jgi:Fic family protein
MPAGKIRHLDKYGYFLGICKFGLYLHMDTNGYVMDISDYMQIKMGFKPEIYQKISLQLSILDTYKGSWKVKANPQGKYMRELRKTTIIESTGSSSRIEDARMTNEKVKKLLATKNKNNISSFESPDEQEVAGYYDALELILKNFREIEVSETDLHQLHEILLNYSVKDQAHRGSYKTSSNKLVVTNPDGSQRLLFNPTPPHLTPDEMIQLIDWLKDRIKHQDMHPLVYIAGFVYEFLSIHPYKDGNGRLSRLLTTLLLMKHGYEFIQFGSFENEIESSKEEYFRVLMEGQQNRYKENESIEAWVLYFLQGLITLTEKLDARYEVFSKLKIALNKRQQKVLDFIKYNEPCQVGDIEKALNESRNTLKKDLAYLVRERLLLMTGDRKGSRYHLLEKEGA